MLSLERTLELIRESKAGVKEAKEELLINNLKLLKSIIKRFVGRGVEYDDLFQLASIGFVKAIDNFDESFNVKFSTYAVPMIIGEIKRFLRDDGSIKVSRIIKTLNSKINKYLDELRKNNQEEPSIEDIAKKFDISCEDVILALGSSRQPVSIYEKLNGDNDKPIEFLDTLESKTGEEELIEKIMLKEMIDTLEDKEKQIIMLRYFSDRTQQEIAKELGVSQVQVSRMENKIINKLKMKIS